MATSHSPVANCACGVHEAAGRKAVGIDPEIKAEAERRPALAKALIDAALKGKQ